MKKIILSFWLLIPVFSFSQESKHNLSLDSLPTRWDEALPIGNGMLGALIWNKDGNLRFSLDQAELWDERPMKGLHRKEFSYKWIQDQVFKKDYKPVQDNFDWPYDHEPAPTKIPGGAVEFNIKNVGKIISAQLDIKTATAIVSWEKGTVLKTFIHATKPIGFFSIENIPSDVDLDLIAPLYNDPVRNVADPVGGDDLGRLGYKQGEIRKTKNNISYLQEGWGGFKYKITIEWNYTSQNSIQGAWTISIENKKKKFSNDQTLLNNELNIGIVENKKSHLAWWNAFWNRSTLKVPDPVIEKQWYLEQYKFGSTSRRGAPPISLQAIWTADNGRIPPWKGDYHHDLNTQLSYWPSYSGNHLEEGMAYLDHLDQNKENYKRYTKLFFGVDGLAVPGVTTLDGTEMGGWIQYSLSPTVSSWLSHHYYLQWRYSMDTAFLKERAYPWIKDVAVFLEKITSKNEKGIRKLPISSSPEINDNSLSAWFLDNTNYDISLMKFNFSAAKELALELGLKKESMHWDSLLKELPDLALSNKKELMFAPTLEYNISHRHFSHMMAIHPLGLIKWENGKNEQEIIQNTIALLDSIGPDYWCGYSYAWESNIKARAKDGEGAAKALSIFANAFCSSNSFHLNGDQTKSGLSKYTYRPFTLEGNFAFAAGLQEMLLQSHAGYIELFPAIPSSWKDVSFNSLRTEGAFLVSASMELGYVKKIIIRSEKDGVAKIKLPTPELKILSQNDVKIIDEKNGFITAVFKPGAALELGQ
jgi:hypothetical protein